MKQVVVCVFDSASQLYGRPFFVAAVGQATRSFTDEVNRADSEMHKHPSDFSLVQLGFYDDSTGEFFNEHRALLRAKDVVNPEE